MIGGKNLYNIFIYNITLVKVGILLKGFKKYIYF